MEIRRIEATEWQVGRDVRLGALADSPTAFATTHAEARERTDDSWREWAASTSSSDEQALFLAWDGDEAVGIAGMFHGEAGWIVFSMWVNPAHRGAGIGHGLLDAAVGFAHQHGATEVLLHVTDGNDAARALYERYGFVDTGHTQPLREGSELVVREMKL